MTLHSLRHSFAGVAEQLGATIPTITAMLGHRLSGVIGSYILKRVDSLLIDAANRVGDYIAALMRGEEVTANADLEFYAPPPGLHCKVLPCPRLDDEQQCHPGWS